MRLALSIAFASVIVYGSANSTYAQDYSGLWLDSTGPMGASNFPLQLNGIAGSPLTGTATWCYNYPNPIRTTSIVQHSNASYTWYTYTLQIDDLARCSNGDVKWWQISFDTGGDGYFLGCLTHDKFPNNCILSNVFWRRQQAAPALTISSPLSGAAPQSHFAALTGIGPPNAMLNILVGGLPTSQVQVDSAGTWEALAYVSAFGSSVTIQLQDTQTLSTSNSITVHPNVVATHAGPSTPFERFARLRHGDILVDGDISSAQVILYGPNYTHTALYLGGDSQGTPLIAEAVTSGEAGSLGEVRAVPLERSLLWSGLTVSGFTASSPLDSTVRDSIVSWAKSITSQGLHYWDPATDLVGPIVSADAIYIASAGLITPRFRSLFNVLDANKNSTSKFICSTLVWRAYYEGTSHTVDISTPNLMSIAPGSILGNLPTPFVNELVDQLRSVFIVPETFVRSPKLRQIF